MKEGEPIIIEKVSNGFILSPKSTTLMNLEDIKIFESLGGLKLFLESHFKTNGLKKEN